MNGYAPNRNIEKTWIAPKFTLMPVDLVTPDLILAKRLQ